MHLLVLGSSSSIPRPGRACSSYLVRTTETAVCLDFGTGAFSNLRSAAAYETLDGIIVSHMHADHFLDIVPLRNALAYGTMRREHELPLWLPPGGKAVLQKLSEALDRTNTHDYFDRVFALQEYDPLRSLEIGELCFTFAPAEHYISAFAMRAQLGSKSLTFSGDTAPCQSVAGLAASSDLFLCEATVGLGSEEGVRGHCSAAEAGGMARYAGAAELALTHYGADAHAQQLSTAARAMFGGPVEVVDDGDELTL